MGEGIDWGFNRTRAFLRCIDAPVCVDGVSVV